MDAPERPDFERVREFPGESAPFSATERLEIAGVLPDKVAASSGESDEEVNFDPSAKVAIATNAQTR
jgi:hypothetical protein